MQWEAVNIPEPGNPVGAKGVGEVAALAGSAAVLCAIQNAIGNRCVLRTPVTPDRVLEALAAKGARFRAVDDIRLRRIMAVIHDVMPAFLLLQPGSLADARKLLEQQGPDAWILAGGLDSFDWLKDRMRKPKAVIDLSGVQELKGVRSTVGWHRDRRDDHADRRREPPTHSAEIPRPRGGGRSGGVTADPQPGNHRRERLAGRSLLVLPGRLAVLPRGRKHLLRGYPRRAQPGARHSPRGAVRGGESVRHRAGADRARRQIRAANGEGRTGDQRGRLLRRPGHRYHATDISCGREICSPASGSRQHGPARSSISRRSAIDRSGTFRCSTWPRR